MSSSYIKQEEAIKTFFNYTAKHGDNGGELKYSHEDIAHA